jgi:translation initiation factor 1
MMFCMTLAKSSHNDYELPKGQNMRLLAGTPYDRPPTCERCGRPEEACQCPPVVIPRSAAPPDKKTVKLAVEKRKKGKVVTVIRGLLARETDLAALLSKLKNQCGAGGTIDGDTLEIQGNHLERLRTLLGEAGYGVRG